MASKHFHTAKNTCNNRIIIGEASVVHSLFIARYKLGKDVPAAMKNAWRR
jgi:hypothetical protein